MLGCSSSSSSWVMPIQLTMIMTCLNALNMFNGATLSIMVKHYEQINQDVPWTTVLCIQYLPCLLYAPLALWIVPYVYRRFTRGMVWAMLSVGLCISALTMAWYNIRPLSIASFWLSALLQSFPAPFIVSTLLVWLRAYVAPEYQASVLFAFATITDAVPNVLQIVVMRYVSSPHELEVVLPMYCYICSAILLVVSLGIWSWYGTDDDFNKPLLLVAVTDTLPTNDNNSNNNNNNNNNNKPWYWWCLLLIPFAAFQSTGWLLTTLTEPLARDQHSFTTNQIVSLAISMTVVPIVTMIAMGYWLKRRPQSLKYVYAGTIVFHALAQVDVTWSTDWVNFYVSLVLLTTANSMLLSVVLLYVQSIITNQNNNNDNTMDYEFWLNNRLTVLMYLCNSVVNVLWFGIEPSDLVTRHIWVLELLSTVSSGVALVSLLAWSILYF